MSTPSTKRVPPPCWTSDETLSLINAYGARWLSLNRSNLRTSDWDAISSSASESSPRASKSSIQCRLKIEKLRKRYRSEKQRSLSFPGRFVSSWDLFPLLDSMNFGSSSAARFTKQKIVNITEFGVKTGNDKSLMSKYGKIDGHLTPDFALNRGLMRNYGNIDYDDDDDDDCGGLETRAKDYVKVNGDFGVGFGVKMEDGRNFVTPQGYRLNSYKKIEDEKSCPRLHNVDGFPLRTFGDRISVPPQGFKPKNLDKVEGNFNHPIVYSDNADYVVVNGSGSEFYAKILGHRDFVPVGTRLRYSGRVDGNLNGNVDLQGMNMYDSSSRLRFGKKNGDGEVKRYLAPFEELASSITLVTEKFVKMEKMKMEMAKETQKMWMEMEMKHNQMILESQQHILDTFVSGLLENRKKKKVKAQVVSPKTTGKRDEV